MEIKSVKTNDQSVDRAFNLLKSHRVVDELTLSVANLYDEIDRWRETAMKYYPENWASDGRPETIIPNIIRTAKEDEKHLDRIETQFILNTIKKHGWVPTGTSHWTHPAFKGEYGCRAAFDAMCYEGVKGMVS